MSIRHFDIAADIGIRIGDLTAHRALLPDRPLPSFPDAVNIAAAPVAVVTATDSVARIAADAGPTKGAAVGTAASGEAGIDDATRRGSGPSPIHIPRHAPRHAPPYWHGRDLWLRSGGDRRRVGSFAEAACRPDHLGADEAVVGWHAGARGEPLHPHVKEIFDAFCIEHCLLHSDRTIRATFDVITRTIMEVNDRRSDAGLPRHARPAYEQVRRQIRRIEGPLREWCATHGRDGSRPLN